MNAKNGELGIARFDSDDKSKRWDEHVCFVTGRNKSETKFVYWEHKSNHTLMYEDVLPKGRVVSATPKPGKEFIFIGGEFCKLTIDDVVPTTKETLSTLFSNVSTDTSKIKLGDCYHTGKAYCLGYRNGHGEEIELDKKLFTGLDGGIEGGAKAALKRHPEEFPMRDIPRFIVELSAVRIIDEDTSNCDEDDDNFDDDGYCNECGEIFIDCECEDICDIDGCWCNDRHLDNTEICECGYHDEDCCCDTDEFDYENVDQTFRPMNAFARAQWLKSCR